jgi:hypothetical protein
LSPTECEIMVRDKTCLETNGHHVPMDCQNDGSSCVYIGQREPHYEWLKTITKITTSCKIYQRTIVAA